MFLFGEIYGLVGFNNPHIIDTYTYGTKNDKAFAIGGMKTRGYENALLRRLISQCDTETIQKILNSQ
ncbi:HindVP family restriction endonuclease [Candidatus Uhrbacteria bacterium]|nr:HindVP family restriction endonuclease [Candidatus Uhrbacteria bacterium]